MLVATRRPLGMMVVEALGVTEVAEAPVAVNVVGARGRICVNRQPGCSWLWFFV